MSITQTPTPRIVITGPPGSGKTSVLSALKSRGVMCVEEAARKVIAEQRHIGGRGTSEQDPEFFISLMLKQAVGDYLKNKPANCPVYFDRGIPDLLAYAEYYALNETVVLEACHTHRYSDTIIFAPAWREIYAQDEERRMSFEEAESFGALIYQGYKRTGYEIADLPIGSIEERVEFILQVSKP